METLQLEQKRAELDKGRSHQTSQILQDARQGHLAVNVGNPSRKGKTDLKATQRSAGLPLPLQTQGAHAGAGLPSPPGHWAGGHHPVPQGPGCPPWQHCCPGSLGGHFFPLHPGSNSHTRVVFTYPGLNPNAQSYTLTQGHVHVKGQILTPRVTPRHTTLPGSQRHPRPPRPPSYYVVRFPGWPILVSLGLGPRLWPLWGLQVGRGLGAAWVLPGHVLVPG